MPVVNFLNVIGVDWPYLDEDTIHQFASLVREFGQAVEQTHQDATDTVAKLARAHQSASTRRMQSGWAGLSGRHVAEVVEGAGIAEAALPVIIEAGKKPGQSLIQDLEQYVIGKVVQAALKPFEQE